MSSVRSSGKVAKRIPKNSLFLAFIAVARLADERYPINYNPRLVITSERSPDQNPPADKIPPTTRKRKAAEAKISAETTDTLPNKRVVASAAATDAAPPTPITGMDSDEDFLSTISSGDDGMQDDTDNDDLSGGEGMSVPVNPLLYVMAQCLLNSISSTHANNV